jgi:hypothetical protein
MRSAKPWPPRARNCRLAGPVTARTTSPLEPAMLDSATVAANTSATAIAIPIAANSSCAACTRRRRR